MRLLLAELVIYIFLALGFSIVIFVCYLQSPVLIERMANCHILPIWQKYAPPIVTIVVTMWSQSCLKFVFKLSESSPKICQIVSPPPTQTHDSGNLYNLCEEIGQK